MIFTILLLETIRLLLDDLMPQRTPRHFPIGTFPRPCPRLPIPQLQTDLFQPLWLLEKCLLWCIFQAWISPSPFLQLRKNNTPVYLNIDPLYAETSLLEYRFLAKQLDIFSLRWRDPLSSSPERNGPTSSLFVGVVEVATCMDAAQAATQALRIHPVSL